MRKNLEDVNQQRMRFRATVGRTGSKIGYTGKAEPTIVFEDVSFAETGEPAASHVWFKCGLWSGRLHEGQTVEFDARVMPYRKGYRGHRDNVIDAPPPSIDFHLTRPTKVRTLDVE